MEDPLWVDHKVLGTRELHRDSNFGYKWDVYVRRPVHRVTLRQAAQLNPSNQRKEKRLLLRCKGAGVSTANFVMDLFAVFGDPIDHSLSPQMHNAAFQAVGRRATYVPVQCPPEVFWDRLDAFHRLNGRGVNLTRPLKELVVPKLKAGSIWVDKTQAANALVWDQGGWIGDNTDVQALISRIPTTFHNHFGGTAWVLGQGGAARSTIVALQTQGYEVVVFGRHRAPGLKHVDWVQWDYSRLEHPRCDIFVNATPLGQMGEAPWLVSPVFDAATLVVDWVYRPNDTPLIRMANQAGCAVVDGLTLLIDQAALSWHLWFDLAGPRDIMADALRDFSQ